VQGRAGGRDKRRAVWHGRGTGRRGQAGRTGRRPRSGRVAADGRGGVQAQRSGARSPSGGHRTARAQVRRGRGPNRCQGVHGGRAGRQARRIHVRDAGRGGRLRRVHQTAGQRQRPQEERLLKISSESSCIFYCKICSKNIL